MNKSTPAIAGVLLCTNLREKARPFPGGFLFLTVFFAAVSYNGRAR